jgi:hypothetical protein
VRLAKRGVDSLALFVVDLRDGDVVLAGRDVVDEVAELDLVARFVSLEILDGVPSPRVTEHVEDRVSVQFVVSALPVRRRSLCHTPGIVGRAASCFGTHISFPPIFDRRCFD